MTRYVSSRILKSDSATATLPNDGFGSHAYPNWARWVEYGSAGITSDGALSPASGGEYTTKPYAVIDLSAALSNILGRQVTQNHTFRISYLDVQIENDDAGDDNDEGLALMGRFRWYSPTTHRVNAYQAYRECWKTHYGGGSTSASMVFGQDGGTSGYKALRVGICDSGDTEAQVPYPSSDPFSDVSEGYPQLYRIFEAYDTGMNAVGDDATNRLWKDGRTGHPEALAFGAHMKQGHQIHIDRSSSAMNGLNVESMCGLLQVVIDSTQSDDSFSFDDEYHVRVTIGVDGWGGDF